MEGGRKVVQASHLEGHLQVGHLEGSKVQGQIKADGASEAEGRQAGQGYLGRWLGGGDRGRG